jgi:hypothetical protein
VGFSLVQAVFQDVYIGETTSYEGQGWIHRFCNQKGLNPAVKAPISVLLMTQEGQEEINRYEEFIKSVNWLMAKLSARVITVEEATENFQQTFFIFIAKKESNLCEVLEKRWEKQERIRKYDVYFSCSSCQPCVKNDQNFY